MVRRKVIKKDKGSEVKADDGISEETIVLVQRLKEIVVNFSEEEIYATLLDCKMEAGLAIDRLLSQGRCEQGEDTSLPQGVDGNGVHQGGEDKEKPDTSRLIGDVDQGGEGKEKPDRIARESASLGLRPPSAASGQQHGGTYLRQSQYRNRYIPPHRRLSSYRQQEQEPYRDPSGNSYRRMRLSSYRQQEQDPYRDPSGNSYKRMWLSSYRQLEQEPYRDPSGNSYRRRQQRLGPRDKRLIKINQLTFCLAIFFLLSLLCMAMIGFFLLFLSA